LVNNISNVSRFRSVLLILFVEYIMLDEMKLLYDRIGIWSIIKLQIIEEYAKTYSEILSSRRKPSFHHVYIDAFAGSGKHVDKHTGELVPGSPQIALDIHPQFKEYHFIDIDGAKVNELRGAVAQRPEARVYGGDCNTILIEEVFPRVLRNDYKRGLCLLDPYGLHLKWEVIETAGKMESIDMFLNFPIADINRNVLWQNPENVTQENIQRMNNYWGDESWKEKAYSKQTTFFGWQVKQPTETIVAAFQERLRDIAGFKYVPNPLPMRNSKRAIVYYLFFASQQLLAESIIVDIFDKYRRRGYR